MNTRIVPAAVATAPTPQRSVDSIFAFQLGDLVTKDFGSGNLQEARIIGRAHFNYCEPQYQVLRRNEAGTTTQEWWNESQIKPR